MKILVATADTDLARVLPLVLGPDGHHVSLHDALATATAALDAFGADVLLVDRELPDGSGLDLIQASATNGASPRTLVMTRVSPNKDKALREALVNPLVEWVRRPFDVLALAGRLRTGGPDFSLAPASTEGVSTTAAAGSDADQGSERSSAAGHMRPALHVVCEVWRKKHTGAVCCELPGGATPAAMVAQGGHIDAGGLEVLRLAVATGLATFRPSEVDATGDHRSLGQMLWTAAIQAANPDFLVARRFLALTVLGDRAAIDRLPIGVHTAKVLEIAAQDLKIGDLIRSTRVPGDEVGPELAALSTLGLVRFSSPRGVPAPPPTRAPAQSAPSRSTSSSAPGVEDASGPPAAQRPTLLRKRLRRELEVLQVESSPFSVLGLVPGATVELLEAAHQRMRPRYTEVIDDEKLPQDVRDMAQTLLGMVDTAWDTIQEKGVARAVQEARPSRPKPEAAARSEETVAFEAGLSAAKAEDWKRADAAFTRAHNLRIDNALTLAWLGWSRFHNENVGLELRTEEARDYLLLAEQFDPTMTLGQMYLAKLLVETGEPESAVLRLKRVLRLEEEHEEAQALLDSIVIEEPEE